VTQSGILSIHMPAPDTMGCDNSKAATEAPRKPAKHPSLLTTPRSKLQLELQNELQEMEQGIIHPTGPHTHTVIMLHGLGNKGSDFVSARGSKGLPATIADLHVDGTAGIKYVFPTAPMRAMYLQGRNGPPSRSRVNAWYTYYSDYSGGDTADDDIIDQQEYDESVQKLVDLVNSEADKLGSARKVIIGGYAQGGTIAISAATAKFNHGLPAALVGIDTLPMAFTILPSSNTGIPAYSFIGEEDDVYPMHLQMKHWKRFESLGHTLTQHIEPGVHHGPYQQVMNEFAARCIVQAFYDASNDGESPSLETAYAFEALELTPRSPCAWWKCSCN